MILTRWIAPQILAVSFRLADNTSAIEKLTALPPVVDHVGIGPIEPGGMRTLHGDTLHGHSISVGAQAPVGIFASQVHASLYSRAARGCKRFASIQQPLETFTGPAPPRAAPNLT